MHVTGGAPKLYVLAILYHKEKKLADVHLHTFGSFANTFTPHDVALTMHLWCKGVSGECNGMGPAFLQYVHLRLDIKDVKKKE